MKTLVEYYKENRIHYRTTWNVYKAGKIPGAFKNEFGKRLWMKSKGCEIEVINEAANDKEDLRQDFVSLVTSFGARLYTA